MIKEKVNLAFQNWFLQFCRVLLITCCIVKDRNSQKVGIKIIWRVKTKIYISSKRKTLFVEKFQFALAKTMAVAFSARVSEVRAKRDNNKRAHTRGVLLPRDEKRPPPPRSLNLHLWQVERDTCTITSRTTPASFLYSLLFSLLGASAHNERWEAEAAEAGSNTLTKLSFSLARSNNSPPLSRFS